MSKFVFTTTAGQRYKNQYEANKNWRENNKDRWNKINREYAKRWREDYPDRIKEIKRKEYLKNRQKYLEKSRLWRINNPDKVKRLNKKFNKKYQEIANKQRCERCDIISETKLCNWCKNDLKTMKLQGKRIILKPIEEKTKSGLILIENQTPDIIKCKIVATGTEVELTNGIYCLISKYNIQDIEWKGENLKITLLEHLIAIE